MVFDEQSSVLSVHSAYLEKKQSFFPLVAEKRVGETNLFYSERCGLNARATSLKKPSLQILESPPNESQEIGISTLFLFEEEKPVGYITFNWKADNIKDASLSINFTRTKHIQQHADKLSPHLVEAIHYGSLMNALEIDEQAKGKGLGKLLLMAGIAHMGNLGFERIHIAGDHSIEQNSDNESFYMKFGAHIDSTHSEVMETEIAIQHADYLHKALVIE